MTFATKVGDKLFINPADLKGYLTAGITGVLRIAGGALVTWGATTPDKVNSVLPQLAPILAGLVMAGGGQAWAWYRENHKNGMIVTAAETEASNIVFAAPPPLPEKSA